MGRNADLVKKLYQQFRDQKKEVGDLYPFHLAISFLDGATSCCNILYVLGSSLPELHTLQKKRELYVNDLGHTLLDALMISILKSHTSTTPGIVDERLCHQTRFAGEEVDVCGRWDADSEAFRALLSNGQKDVPMSWKHKFCHTSIQAICHCILCISHYNCFDNLINHPSGVYLKHCSECGLKMQLTPLHTLVMTAFHLANYGCTDEDLFGILACFLTLLSTGILNPTKKADVSADLLFNGPSMAATGCTHERLTPAEFADRVPLKYTGAWPAPACIGWEVFRRVLHMAQTAATARSDEYLECSNHGFPPAFDGYDQFNRLFAAVVTELLTYRRIHEGEPWMSGNFSLLDLLQGLEKDGYLSSIGLAHKNLLKPFCNCGRFIGQKYRKLASADDACMHYFSNMDDWYRTKFIPFEVEYLFH
jgi:hypothetical protein